MRSATLLLAAAALAAAALSTAQPCSLSALLNDTNFGSTARSKAYPNGVKEADAAACCAVCAKTADCAAFVFFNASSECYPVASYEALIGYAGAVVGVRPSIAPLPPPPCSPDLAARQAAGDLLCAAHGELGVRYLPSIGNGYLATTIGGDAIYAAGVFNGALAPYATCSHRARIPSPLRVGAPLGAAAGEAAIDLRAATYIRRSLLQPAEPAGSCTAARAAAANASCSNAAAPIVIEQRFYAHRALRRVLVMEGAVLPGAPLDARTPPGAPYAALVLRSDPGAPSADIAFAPIPQPPGAPFALSKGETLVAECAPGACGNVSSAPWSVAVLASALPPALPIDAAAPAAAHAFFTVVRTSVDTAPGALEAAVFEDAAAAAALAAEGALHATHAAEWEATVWHGGLSIDRLDVALAANASLYAIMSGLRSDLQLSTSPGGLAGGAFTWRRRLHWLRIWFCLRAVLDSLSSFAPPHPPPSPFRRWLFRS